MRDILALIDPFSQEAKEILSQTTSISSLPENIQEKALNRYRWKKDDTNFPTELIDLQKLRSNIKDEVSTFFFVLQALAATKSPYSGLTRYILSCEHNILSNRLKKMIHELGERDVLRVLSERFEIKLIKEITKKETWIIEDESIEIPYKDLKPIEFSQGSFPKYAIKWSDFTNVFESGVNLRDYYLRSGYLILTPSDFFDLYSSLIVIRIKEYLIDITKKMENIEIHPRIQAFADKLNAEFKTEVSSVSLGDMKAARFDPTSFPPCIKIVLGGLGSGNRNYGLTVVLTSFLSYARLCPYPRGDVKIADCTEDMSIVTEDVMSLINDAAEKCDPPLFSDQPQEKLNVYYHLGLGLIEHPKLSDSGKSKWYRCPNCEKIRREIPIICRPDDFCQKIKNPLQYYTGKKN